MVGDPRYSLDMVDMGLWGQLPPSTHTTDSDGNAIITLCRELTNWTAPLSSSFSLSLELVATVNSLALKMLPSGNLVTLCSSFPTEMKKETK